MRIVFMGTPAFAVPTLKRLSEKGHHIVAVYTQPSRARGRRGCQADTTPIHKLAEMLSLPVYTPESLKSTESIDLFCQHRADVAIVVAYGLLLPPAILEAPTHGCLNLHASLLPRWRGAAPIHRALMAGDQQTGIAIMRMEEGLDTGPVYAYHEIDLPEGITLGEVYDKLALLGAELLCETLPDIIDGCLCAHPQSSTGVCYAHKISKDETRISWTHAAHCVHDHIRALSPTPGAWCLLRLGEKEERLKILEARCLPLSRHKTPPGTIVYADSDHGLVVACAHDAVQLRALQRPGRQPLCATDFLNGISLQPGQRLL